MSGIETLKSLEGLLESFVERVLALKERRLPILDGVNRLDDIAQASAAGQDVTEPVSEWFAAHNRWLSEDSLRPGDHNRISRILSEIRKGIDSVEDSWPELDKVAEEIDRWTTEDHKLLKATMKRGPEPAEVVDEDSIAMFDRTLANLSELLVSLSEGKEHILSVLDDTLKRAAEQKNREALLLSAFIIYYLRQRKYMVEPFVRRLKEAEKLIEGSACRA